MDRKKKKQAAIKSAANVEQQRKALKDRFLDRTKEILSLIGGEDLLKNFPVILLTRLYESRYPVLKAKAAAGSGMNKTKLVQFNKILLEFITGIEVPLPNGNKIPLSWYLSEGLTLSDSVGELQTNGIPELEKIKECFSFCLPDSKFHRGLQETLVGIVTETSILLSDYNDHIYIADISMTPYFARFNPQNDIIVYPHKPKKEPVDTKGGKRNAIRLGWLNQDFEYEHYNVKPSLLGFKTVGLDIPLEIYISTHALERLQSRVNIVPGIMHQILMLTFLQPKVSHRWKGDVSHVDYLVSGEKVGYLLVKMHGNKLIIHTFLFLTNNDTFEGEKLGRLLNIVKEDKKYLEIDTLSAFNSYHFEKNEKLSKLFKEAGCGSLLKMRHIQEFTSNLVADKDPESILQYLADAPYFSKLAAIPD